MTAEQIRFHAAGHLAAASLLVRVGKADAAGVLMGEIVKYVHDAKVDAPPQVKALVADCQAAPGVMLTGIDQLEQWFCDPLNTVIEQAGGFSG